MLHHLLATQKTQITDVTNYTVLYSFRVTSLTHGTSKSHFQLPYMHKLSRDVISTDFTVAYSYLQKFHPQKSGLALCCTRMFNNYNLKMK